MNGIKIGLLSYHLGVDHYALVAFYFDEIRFAYAIYCMDQRLAQYLVIFGCHPLADILGP